MDITGKLNDFFTNSQVSNSNSNITSNSQFSLPKLKLPQFSGKRTEWKAFIALFDKMGTTVEYLKSCISGSASGIIAHLDPVPENYDPCYELLRTRFDNKRKIVDDLLDNVLNIQKIKYESSESLKAIHDTVYESLMAIKNMGISNASLLDHLLCHIILKKLDSSVALHFECQLKNVTELQSLPVFLTYLENRFMALQAIGARNEYNPNNKEKQASSSFSIEKSVKCLVVITLFSNAYNFQRKM